LDLAVITEPSKFVSDIHTRDGEDIDAVIDLRAVFQQAHRELAIEAMPALLLPRKTDLAMSRPIVVTVCMDSSSESWEP
jgi:hypothetical protein